MYIKLGTLNLVYHQNVDDWMIMSEILESGMSYERPILVRTTNELDIWFGREFPGYEFMTELLNQDITLYLYKPVSSTTTGSDGFIDFSKYTVLDDVWLRENETEWVYNVLSDPLRYKFKMLNGDYGFNIIRNTYLVLTDRGISGREYCTDEIVRNDLPDQIASIFLTRGHALFHVYNSDNLWLMYDEFNSIIDSSLLPQNIDFISSSLDNRDTIIIGSGIDSVNQHVPYTHLDYKTGEPNLGIYKDECSIIQNFSGITYFDEIDLNFVNNGFQSFVLRVSGELRNTESEYLILPDAFHGTDSNSWLMIYTGEPPENVDPKYYKGGIIQISDWSEFENIVTSELDYEVYYADNGDLLLVSHTILPVLYFQKSKTLNVTPEIKITQKILSKFIENPCFEMWSKTIGRGSKFDDSDLITVEIEKPDDFGKNYRVTISRYSYSETFEGPVDITDPGNEERLDYIITNKSKLVSCNYLGGTVRTGTFQLRGGEIEKTNPEMYEYSLDKMFSESMDPVFPDYFFVPDVYKYVNKENLDLVENDYFPIYKKFLEYSKQLDFQFLIENVDPYNIETVNELPAVEERKSDYYKIPAKYYTITDKNEVLDEKKLSLLNEYSSITVSKDPQVGDWADDNTYYIYEIYYNSQFTPIINQTIIDNGWSNGNIKIVKEFPSNPITGKIYLIRKYFKGKILIDRKYIIDNIENYKALTVEKISASVRSARDYKYLKVEEVYYDKNGDKIEDMLFLKTCNGNYTMNYIEDTENRLVYFYRNFSFFEHKRPAYYIYLNGLLNDIYSVSTKDILYIQPTGNPFEDEKIETNLEKYKSNYLVCDNQTYYYKKYQDGKTWITTGWMRFVAGKISRELQKNKWNYLGLPLMGKTRTIIEEILYRVNNSFSIVESIIMTKFEPVPTSNLLNIEINTYTNDLVKNNLKLDVTLDYNNINKLD